VISLFVTRTSVLRFFQVSVSVSVERSRTSLARAPHLCVLVAVCCKNECQSGCIGLDHLITSVYLGGMIEGRGTSQVVLQSSKTLL
jgi:hypothetical protein